MNTINYVCLDVETGGFDATQNPITQIALMSFEPKKFKEINRFESFIKPYNNLKITKQALDSSMVSMNDVNNGLDHKKIVQVLMEFFKDANSTKREKTRPIIVGHNVKFDIGFIEYIFALNGKNLWEFVSGAHVDTLVDAKRTWDSSLSSDDIQSYKLSACCKRAGIKLTDAHGAMADTIATRKLFIWFSDKLRGVSVVDTGNLERATKQRQFFEM